MRVMLGLIIAATLLLGTSFASPVDTDAVVEEASATSALIQKHAGSVKAEKKDTALYAMTCVERKQEALHMLMNLNAAKTLQKAASKFKVQDTKTDWRVDEWHTRYVKSASDYAFFCEQSDAENDKVARTIHTKEGLEAKKVALRALQDATFKQKEKEGKARIKASEKKEKADADAHEKKQKKLIKLMADKARLERLRSYPQSTMDLIGFVADANTGGPLTGVEINSRCPFDMYKSESKEPSDASSNALHSKAQYTIKNGITGPEGYRCQLEYKKEGYIPLAFRIVIPRRTEGQGLFRHAILMPRVAKPPPFRIVLQYGDIPVHVDGHLQLYATGTKEVYDIAGHRGNEPRFMYSPKGDAEKLPFMTLDANKNEGYGPQTHTIHKLEAGSYGYYVKNYDHHFTNDLEFHNSDAKVFIYQGNKQTHRFTIRNAQGSASTFWQVFALQCAEAGRVNCEVVPIEAFVKKMPTSATLT